MIDLSITKNPEWIQSRQAVWETLEEDFKEGLRKKELQELKTYFFTGVFPGQRDFPDRAYFKWFPLQTPEGWDYVLQYLVSEGKVFEDSFYASLGDLTGSGLTPEQELMQWDYFAGEEYKPTITSRVPVGKEKKIVSFNVDAGKIAAKFSLGIKGWLSGTYVDEPKWIKKINYFTSFISQLPDSTFEKDGDGEFIHRAAKAIKSIFKALIDSQLIVDSSGHELTEEKKRFLVAFPIILDNLDASQGLKTLWKEAKKGSQ